MQAVGWSSPVSRPMYKGKSAWNAFTARTEFSSHPREAGHEGILTSFYIFDGLFSSALGRRFRAWHDSYYTLKSDILGDAGIILRAKDIVIPLHCAAHATSLSVKWSLQEYVSSP